MLKQDVINAHAQINVCSRTQVKGGLLAAMLTYNFCNCTISTLHLHMHDMNYVEYANHALSSIQLAHVLEFVHTMPVQRIATVTDTTINVMHGPG